MTKLDETIREYLSQSLEQNGVHVHSNGCSPKKFVEDNSEIITITFENGETWGGFDIAILAVGRHPCAKYLDLENCGVALDPKKETVIVDEYETTTASHIFAVGDVTGKLDLTPMAIAAGRKLADRLFSEDPLLREAKASYENVPTVIFNHPPVGTVGLTEKEARERYQDNVEVYTSEFINLYYGPWDLQKEKKPKSFVKMICKADDNKVVGLHLIGKDCDEMLQGFAVAIKMGATKGDFDNCLAIHPTGAEEVVTLKEWGKLPPSRST